ncbi:hypothetical protein VTK26DRAFT_2098 [Humicola hyalothermophila]
MAVADITHADAGSASVVPPLTILVTFAPSAANITEPSSRLCEGNILVIICH